MEIDAKLIEKLMVALKLQNDLDSSMPQRKERTYLKNLVVDDREDSKLRYAALTERTFAKAGYKDNRAHETILTAKKWYAKGYMIRKGEKAVKVRGLPLYHKDQMVLMSAADKPQDVPQNVVAAYLAAQAAAKPTDEQIEAYLRSKAEAAAKQQAEAEAAYGSSY